jgi:putative ABC transport system ATP-binding protein
VNRSETTTWAVLRRALSEAPALRRGLIVTLTLAMAGQAIAVVTPIVLQKIIDEEILDPAGINMAGVVSKATIALGALIVGVVVGRVALLRLVRSSSEGLSDLRTKTFDHILRQSVLLVESERRGSLVSRVTSDISTLQQFMEWGGVGLIVATSQVMLASVVMVVYEWRLALIALAGVFLYLLMLRWFQKILAKNYDQVRREVGASLAVLSEAISAVPTVRAYGIEEEVVNKVEHALERRFQVEYRTARFGNVLFSTAEVFAGILTAALVVAGVLIGIQQGMSAGTLVAFFFLANLLIEPLQIVVETLDFAQSAASGLRRVLTVLDGEVEISEPDSPVHLPLGGLGVSFEGVSFTYPGGTEALRDVSVELPQGARVAVVGKTGSGKTTFAKLMVRLLEPQEGTIRVGGVPLPRVSLEELRARVAFVPQEGFLFDTTLAENVRYGALGVEDAEIWAALRAVGLGEWVERLPQGLETRVGERGSSLSAGERQLVALVRAWIVSPDLLVLDEATSAVDPALEVSLRAAIKKLTEGRTSVTVAHRLSTAEDSDEVLVFDQGRLVERGSHLDLLAADGVYAALYADWAVSTRS